MSGVITQMALIFKITQIYIEFLSVYEVGPIVCHYGYLKLEMSKKKLC